MKHLFSALGMLFLLLISCQHPVNSQSVDANTFKQKLSTTPDKVILDVRTAEEYASGYIGDAINLDYYNPAFKDQATRLDKSKTYFVYCEAGGRSKSAAGILHDAGFTKIVELNGGISEWKATGLPLTYPGH